jgi:hypothetical protein
MIDCAVFILVNIIAFLVVLRKQWYLFWKTLKEFSYLINIGEKTTMLLQLEAVCMSMMASRVINIQQNAVVRDLFLLLISIVL